MRDVILKQVAQIKARLDEVPQAIARYEKVYGVGAAKAAAELAAVNYRLERLLSDSRLSLGDKEDIGNPMKPAQVVPGPVFVTPIPRRFTCHTPSFGRANARKPAE